MSTPLALANPHLDGGTFKGGKRARNLVFDHFLNHLERGTLSDLEVVLPLPLSQLLLITVQPISAGL